MKLLNIIITLLLITLIAPAASGELIINKHTNDFVLSSPTNEQIKLCSCETRVDTVIVENIGQFAASFNIWVDTDWPGSVRIAETNFDLEAKEFKEITIYIADSCDITGTFDYTVRAINTYGREESLTRSVRADYCEAVRLDVSPDVEIGLCEEATFTVTTTNVGRHVDTFRLEVPGADVPIPDMYLAPEESITQDVTVSWSCTEHGTKDVPFTIHTDKHGTAETIDRYVEIRNEYAFGLGLSTEMRACALSTTRVPFSVENPIHVPEEIELSVSAPPYVTFADGERSTRVQVEPESTRDVELTISPELPGEHTVTVTAKDIYGGTVKERDVQLIVENCYEQDVELRITEDTPFDGVDIDCCGVNTYYVNVQNNAEREQLFQLDIDGPSFFLLEERTIRLQPSQSTNVKIFADLPCSDEAYQATVTVYPVEQPQLAVERTLDITSYTPRTCHMVQIDDDELTVREEETTIPVTIKHTGLEGGTYDVRSNSSLFTFTVDSIELQPGDERTLYLTPVKDLVEQEKGRYLVFPMFVHEQQGIPYNEHLGVELSGKGFVERFLDWMFSFSLAGWTGCAGWVLFLFLVLIVVLVVLLLVYFGRYVPFPGGIAPGTLSLWRTALVIAILAAIILFLLIPAPDVASRYTRIAEGNATVLEWYEGEKLSLNLDDYFADPDLDDLSYEVSQPRDVRADIDESLLTLTPDEGFTGENTFTVTAYDAKDGVADSPEFILRIIAAKENSLTSWICLWCPHVILLELMLIFILLFFLVLSTKEKRQDLKSQNVVVVVPKVEKRVRKVTRFYASKTGTKAHIRGCMALKPVKQHNRVTYKSKTAVLNAGLALCSMCTKAPVRKAATKKRSTKKAVKKTSSKKRAKKTVRKKRAKKASSRKRSKKVVKKRSSKKKITKKSRRKPTKAVARTVKAVPVSAPKKPKSSKEQKTVNIQVNIDQK